MMEEKNPVGRPLADIDWVMFEQLCSFQCTQSEIASLLKISVDTLVIRAKSNYQENNFSDIYKKFSESGKCSLRRFQFIQSKKNAAMAIWLGKNWLGQRDQTKEEIKQLTIETLYETLRAEGIIGTGESTRSGLEDKKSVLDQGCLWKQDQIQTELGTRNSPPEPTPMQHNTESQAARYDDIPVPPLLGLDSLFK